MTGAIKNGQEFYFNIAIEKFLELNEFEGDKQYKWVPFTMHILAYQYKRALE